MKNLSATGHYFLLDVQEVLYESEDSDLIRNLNMYVVNQFYRKLMMRSGIFMSSFMSGLQQVNNCSVWEYNA